MNEIEDKLNSLTTEELNVLNSDPKMLADFKTKYSSPKADDKGNYPNLDKQGKAVQTFDQAINFERGGFNKFSTSPPEQRVVENVNHAASGMAAVDLGLSGLKVGAKLLGKGVSLASDATGATSLLSKLENWAGNVLERSGARGINQAANVGVKTVENMAKYGENPGKVGIELGGKLADSKAIVSDPIKTFDNAAVQLKTAGENVGKAWSDIAKYSGNNDGMVVEANQALDPIKNMITELRSNPLSAVQKQAKPLEEMYTDLAKTASADGKLSVEAVQNTLKTVGKRMTKGSKDTQQQMSEMYGVLANVRDGMVKTLSDQVSNPALKENLVKANEDYSRWIRLLPDLKRASTKEVVGDAANHGFISNIWEGLSYPFKNPAAKAKMIEIGKGLQARAQGFPLSSSNQSELGRTLNLLQGAKRAAVVGIDHAQ